MMTSIELNIIQTAGIGALALYAWCDVEVSFADLINTGIVTLFLNLL